MLSFPFDMSLTLTFSLEIEWEENKIEKLSEKMSTNHGNSH